MKKRNHVSAVFLLTLLFLFGCAAPRSREGAPGMQSAERRVKIEPEARTLYSPLENN